MILSSVRLCVRLSVALCVVANDTAKGSEQVNRKCTLETRFYNFQPPTPTHFPQTPDLLNHIDVGAIWRIH